MRKGDIRMVKQCGYCFRVLGDDGTYHGIGLIEPIVHLDVVPPKAEQVPVSHGICADCFQVMVTPKSEIPGNGTLHCDESASGNNLSSTKTASFGR
jgi:hypothetical protein